MRRPYSPAERQSRTNVAGQLANLDGISRAAVVPQGGRSLSQALGATPGGSAGSVTTAAPATVYVIETGFFDDLTLAVLYRFGIDDDGNPYFDETGATPTSQAARLMLNNVGQPQLEPLP